MKIIAAAKKLSHPYEPHLQISELSLAAGREWTPLFSGWSMMQIGSGSGYWLQEQSREELAAGTVLLIAGNVPGRILASRLNGLRLHYFTVMPELLMGLITQGEYELFKQSAAQRELACQILPPAHPVAAKMGEFCASVNRGGLRFRLILLQLLIEAFGSALEEPPASLLQTDVRERLRVFLADTPPAALLEVTFEEMAQMTHCTPRHLSRVFYELVGKSFRDKRAEIRLARARELLATSRTKVVEVAYKSGYKSLSLFNRMFTRRFGISPGRWRQKNGGVKTAAHRQNSRLRTAAN